MRKLALGVALWALCGAPALAQNSSCPVAGRYSVSGKQPGASGAYHGEAQVRANGTGCYMKWLPPNTSEGVGSFVGNVLTINFELSGQRGVVQYTRQSTGELRGVWWMNSNPGAQGTESLFPIELYR